MQLRGESQASLLQVLICKTMLVLHNGITVPTWLIHDRATRYIRRKLGVSFAMKLLH
jgi:hypothetical protein